jgi:aminoglycoside phosphotransferase (APT) family kinase protein
VIARGPLATAAAALLARHATRVSAVLERYDGLVVAGRAAPVRMVLTHGEPHPGNTILTADGWLLIDWDTALVAPPERDLWIFDRAAVRRYTEATGVILRPDMVALYRTRWTLADIAVEAHRFRRPHTGSPEDTKALRLLEANLATLSDG